MIADTSRNTVFQSAIFLGGHVSQNNGNSLFDMSIASSGLKVENKLWELPRALFMHPASLWMWSNVDALGAHEAGQPDIMHTLSDMSSRSQASSQQCNMRTIVGLRSDRKRPDEPSYVNPIVLTGGASTRDATSIICTLPGSSVCLWPLAMQARWLGRCSLHISQYTPVWCAKLTFY